jgi:hypothetical protein
MSNIQSGEAYDPFPKTGLTRQYEPFIRQYVTDFCKQYPKVSRSDALFEAVKISIEFEPKFKTESGLDFSTPLRHHLKGLKRILVNSEAAHNKRLIHAASIPDVTEDDYSEESSPDVKNSDAPGEIAKKLVSDAGAAGVFDQRVAEEKLEALPVTSGTGGNGTRIKLDLNSSVIGRQLYSKEPHYALRIIDRLSVDLRILIGCSPVLAGRMRAVIAHGERCQREADREAENQRNGDYRSVFLEAHDTLRPDIQFRPLKEQAAPKLDASKPVSESRDLTRLDPVLREYSQGDRAALLVGAAEAMRPSLDKRECAILDWLLNPHRRNLTALAKQVGITKGYASKLRGRVLDLLRKQMTATPEKCTQLIGRGCEILIDRDLKEKAEIDRRWGRARFDSP